MIKQKFFTQQILIIFLASILLSCSSKKEQQITSEWGAVENGLRTRLIPLEQDYIIGKPMTFRLEMTNVGNSQIFYDSQQVHVNDPFIIKRFDGKFMPYIAGSYQTGGGPKPINPREVITLIDKYDIAANYYIEKPGIYMIQHRGQGEAFGDVPIPPSNMIQLKIQIGKLPQTYILISNLLEIIPEQWKFDVYSNLDGTDLVTPRGRQSANGIHAALVHWAGFKKDLVYIEVWQTNKEVDLLQDQINATDVSEYLGKFSNEHIYAVIPKKAEELWPDAREKIKKAFEIE